VRPAAAPADPPLPRPSVPSARFRLARAAIGGAGLLLLAVRIAPEGTVAVLTALCGVGGWLALSTLLAASRTAQRRWSRAALGGLLIGDLVATAIAVRIAGDLAGPTLLLLAIPVLAGGLLLEWRAGLVLGLLAAIVSRALALLPGSGIAAAPWTFGLHYVGAFATIGLAAGFLGTRHAASLRDAARSRSELEAMRSSTDRIVESLGCGLIAVDAADRLQTVNGEARRLLGLEGSIPEIEEQLARHHPRVRRLLSAHRGDAAVRDGEGVLRAPGRRPFPAWIKLAPVTDGGGASRGRVLLFWDLTERKRLERAARRSQRLGAVAELSGGLAHEIRNSLRPITGCAELLRSQGLLPETARPMMEIITREADSLEAFLSQFLALARDKSVKLEPFDLDELIRQEGHALTVAGSLAGGEVVVAEGGGVRLRGDRDWLRQVFRNLILNGMEAKPGGTVRVAFRRFRRHGRPWVRVTVEDDGPGIAPGDRRRVFRPFWSGKSAGTGLGLPIALRGVREHGGRIGLETRQTGGTAVRVDLPVNGPADRAVGSLAA
jgi:signal transduction histidine kinase